MMIYFLGLFLVVVMYFFVKMVDDQNKESDNKKDSDGL